MEHWATISSELVGLADQVEDLTPQQWATKSLCGAWTVRDVVAHLVVPRKTSRARFLVPFTAAFLTARGNFDRANIALAAKEAQRPTTELVAALRRGVDSRFRPPGFGSEAPLTDVLIHGQDIRIPLGLKAVGPIEPWGVVLDFVATPKVRRVFGLVPLDGVRLVANDLDWSHGRGDDVIGPAIALALAIMGRNAQIGELAGMGVPTLAARITA